MKIIVCFRHFKCIWRQSRRGMDYTWHVQHLLREFGCNMARYGTDLVQGIPSTPAARLAVQRSRDPVRASLQKVVIMADERFPENDGRWISCPAHGTTRMPFTYALTKLRLSNFGTVPGKS
jgi:hypothetical protein